MDRIFMMFTLLRHIRCVNRWYAKVRGYPWLPCPLCGTYYGGHEVTGASIPQLDRPGYGWCVCFRAECQREAHYRWTAAWGHL